MAIVKTVAITRSKDDAAEFIKLVEDAGMKSLPLPTIELVSRGKKIADEFLDAVKTHKPDYIVFMSSKAVRLLFEAAKRSTKYDELRLAVANTIVIAVGPKTGDALKNEQIMVNAMPKETFSSVGIGELFTKMNAVGKKVIVPRSGASTPFLKELLGKIGLEVTEIYLYDVCAFRDTSQWNEFRELFSCDRVDGIVFTSASSVRGFFEIMTKDMENTNLVKTLSKLHIVAIGPFTASELEKFGVKNTISWVHTVAGSFETLSAKMSV